MTHISYDLNWVLGLNPMPKKAAAQELLGRIYHLFQPHTAVPKITREKRKDIGS